MSAGFSVRCKIGLLHLCVAGEPTKFGVEVGVYRMLIARMMMAVFFGLLFFARVTSDAGASADGYYTIEASDEDAADEADGEDVRR